MKMRYCKGGYAKYITKIQLALILLLNFIEIIRSKFLKTYLKIKEVLKNFKHRFLRF